MDALGIQAKINRGAGIAARYLGTRHTIYRPKGTGNPLARANAAGSLLADFKADFAFTGNAPNLYGHPVWGGLFDRTTTREGDYLVGDQGTFFIAAQQLHAPTACIQCNRVLTAKRPTRRRRGIASTGATSAPPRRRCSRPGPPACSKAPRATAAT